MRQAGARKQGQERGGGWSELAPSQKGLGKGMRKSRAGSVLEKGLGKERGMRMIRAGSLQKKRAGNDQSWLHPRKDWGKRWR